MTITTILGINFMELAESRETTKSVDAQSIPLKYVAWPTIDQGVLNTAFASLVGASFGGLPLDTLKCTPVGGGVWNCEALFSLRVPAPPENNDDTEALGIAYAIDLSAGQIHITQSLETVQSVAVSGTAPDYKHAIGVTKDSVAGTDIFAPKFEFSITVKTYPVTLEFIRTLRNASAKTNNADWKGFAAGELLYLGVTGQAQPNDYWTLTHKFAAGENKTGLVVSPDLTVNKKAWEYLWCAYNFAGSNGGVVQVPQAAYVERVYDSTDFNLLRLDPPVCDWTSTPNPASGIAPLVVQFTDLSTGTPLQWLWTFGDGTTSTLKNPVKTYVVPGVYTVSLTVTNGAGSSFKTVINYVIVS